MISLPSGNCVFSSSYNMKPFPGSFSVKNNITLSHYYQKYFFCVCLCKKKRTISNSALILCFLDLVNSVINIKNTNKDTKMGRYSVKIHINIQIDF